jgi:eukaryotic-like serine/threonine-protein kinase
MAQLAALKAAVGLKTTTVVPLQSGELVGSYRIDELIADGGMGAVYRATHTILPRRAALKVLHARLVGQHAAGERMLQEARILEGIAHPTVVHVYDAGLLSDGRPWVAMELVEGETLASYLWRRGKLSLDEVARIMVAIADALLIAHGQAVVHRDIKPENIMIGGDPLDLRVKLIDWGIACVTNGGNRLTQTDTTPGTPHYMAPEQLRGQVMDGRTDVYALGVLAYELLSGDPPFTGDTPLDVAIQHLQSHAPSLMHKVPGLPGALDTCILKMLAKHPSARPGLTEIRTAFAAAMVEDFPDITVEVAGREHSRMACGTIIT